MPGAGKSTVGIILAKIRSLGFIDTDVLIQINHRKTLQQIISESDYLNLRKIEAAEILKLNVANHVIATGGSAVYSPRAMAHLTNLSTVVFLRVGFAEISRRIDNFESRGIAKAEGQTFQELYDERQVLYHRYARITIDGDDKGQDEIAKIISAAVQDTFSAR